MKIGIIGKGYVGNAVKNGFEQKGFIVKAYDKFKEGDRFEDVVLCDFIFVCVPTPPKEDGSIDLSAIDEVMEKLAKLRPKGIIVIKSTVIPGTTQDYQNKYPNLKFVFNPEFLTTASADQDFLYPDKIAIGYTQGNKKFAQQLSEIYKDFNAPIIILKSEEAEMVKYMINSYYALCVIFANVIYDICQAFDIDYEKVRECFELDKRVSPGHFDVFYGGYRGFGGACLPKDLAALTYKAQELGLDTKLFKTAQEINKHLRKLSGVKQT